MKAVRNLWLIFFISVFLISFVFTVFLDVADYLEVDKRVLFLSLAGLGLSASVIFFVRKSSSCRERAVTYLDPLFYFPVVFVFYCGLGGITWTDSEYEVAGSVYYYYSYFIISFIVGGGVLGFFISSGKVTQPIAEGLNPFRSKVLLLAIFTLGLVAHFYMVSQVGVLILSDDFQSERAEVIGRVGGYVYYISLLLIDFIIISFMYTSINKKRPFPSILYMLLIFFCVMALISLGSRTRVIYPLLVGVVFYIIWNDPKVSLKKTFYVFVAMVSFLIVYGGYRFTTGEGGSFAYAVARISLGEIKLPSITFDMLMKGMHGKIDFFGMKVVYMPFLVLLPGEDEVLVNILKESLGLGYAGGGFTPSLVGSLYLISGLSSVIVGGGALGFTLRLAYIKAVGNGLVCKALFAYLFVYSLNIMKGGLFKDIEPFWHIFVILLILMLSRRRVLRREVGVH